MSTTTPAFRLALTAAALVAAAPTADARPRRVVVLDFDGPPRLADTARETVLSALGSQYDVVATRRWEQARATAAKQTHGPAQWSRAARQSGVDAVIEGWVQDEGRRKILNVVVRQANNGREFDTISVRIDSKAGVSPDSVRQLQSNLDELLDWVDGGPADPPPGLPVVEVTKTAASSSASNDRADIPAPRAVSRSAERTAPAAESPRPPAAPAAAPTAATAPTSAAEPAHDAKPVEVSTAAREAHEIEILFPQGSEERKEVLGSKAEHVPQETPRFMIDAGPYLGSRSLLWNTVDAGANLSQFTGVTTKGVAVNAAIYPFPPRTVDGVLSGFGVTGSIYHSLGSSVELDYGNQVEENVINQNGWELGAHYRAPLSGLVAIDGGVFYGNQTFEILDAPAELDIPDTKYAYLGAGGHLDLAITDRAQIGFGARYFTVLDAGDLASTSYYGPVSASGLGLDGSFVIPLPSRLYVRGQLAYQRISLETSGVGKFTEEQGVTGGTDSQVTGNVSVGVAF